MARRYQALAWCVVVSQLRTHAAPLAWKVDGLPMRFVGLFTEAFMCHVVRTPPPLDHATMSLSRLRRVAKSERLFTAEQESLEMQAVGR